ncbi:hypothetical protein O181_020966 [Austropuccinia psidii MF-1]|uniref:Uncharacterized protein n=1 Tax=Austropuccinia psidii MF-1 TaxID=1389203 RepID=A0A9Q3CEI4_9BASI|nr:hypothetical protein [Austropuccinia psidii MF-1]
MLSQHKLHNIQLLTLHNKLTSQSSRKGGLFSSASEFSQMKGYRSFASPGGIETFEDGVFGLDDEFILSRQDAFIDTLFDSYLQDECNHSDDSVVTGMINGVGHKVE